MALPVGVPSCYPKPRRRESGKVMWEVVGAVLAILAGLLRYFCFYGSVFNSKLTLRRKIAVPFLHVAGRDEVTSYLDQSNGRPKRVLNAARSHHRRSPARRAIIVDSCCEWCNPGTEYEEHSLVVQIKDAQEPAFLPGGARTK